jgi:hypothetical protein
MLILCGLDGVLLLHGVEMDERGIGKDVAEPYILVADSLFEITRFRYYGILTILNQN